MDTDTRQPNTAGTGARPDAPAPAWARLAAPLAACWAAIYGAVRLYWAATGLPDFPPIGSDLVFFEGAGGVVLCGCAVLIAGVLSAPRLPRRATRVLILAGVPIAATLVAMCALLMLDIAGLLFGLGVSTALLPMGSRLGCLAVALLLTAALVAAHRRIRPVCAYCGRAPHAAEPEPGAVPRWAFAAAYLAAASFALRIAAEVAAVSGGAQGPLTAGAGGDLATLAAGSAFLAGAVMAGTVLPLAQVHRWGRVWPRWVLPLAGRAVPRWLVLGPGLVIGIGLVSYFGYAQVEMVAAAITGTGGFASFGGYGTAFFWTAVPAYLMWGAGLSVAAASYGIRTRPRCGHCGRGKRGMPESTGDHSE
ncbi:hypothetical protein CLV63_11960 [Murinocardiopsis flavida]|uniref:Uncharacterized protein n=1 Tax=Murinocardiopsis flavida TaxID=645275 RepID=A0A2P8D3M8_9ACTN|nr:hypothetical protein [Murinocardiopsis flavida]PSK91779.1 hypothetical protein CLV63_11960 [Murinocardiopsis flavida]